MAKHIYLNGPSSSGKTTLAKALQESILEPYLHIGIDKLIGFMPAKLNNWAGGFAPEGFSWEPAVDPTGHPVYQIHAGPFAQRITHTLRSVAQSRLAALKHGRYTNEIKHQHDQVVELIKNAKTFLNFINTSCHQA